MCGNKQYENICKDEFAQVHTKLDKLDESIRGNGKPGILVRLDRLEQRDAKRNKFVWLVVGALVSAIILWVMGKI